MRSRVKLLNSSRAVANSSSLSGESGDSTITMMAARQRVSICDESAVALRLRALPATRSGNLIASIAMSRFVPVSAVRISA